MVIGITGGIGTGKSTVLKLLQEDFGFFVFEADKIGHELMCKGEKVYKQIVDNFGTEILCDNGEINRKIMSGLVFNDKNKLEILNNIVHPAVILEIEKRMDEEKTINKKEMFVIEAALLLESGCDKICDKIWYIYTDDEIRIERLKNGRGMKEEEIKAVMKNQLKSYEFQNKTGHLIDNSKSIEDTRNQIEKLLEF